MHTQLSELLQLTVEHTPIHPSDKPIVRFSGRRLADEGGPRGKTTRFYGPKFRSPNIFLVILIKGLIGGFID